jgi:hypothetical protein
VPLQASRTEEGEAMRRLRLLEVAPELLAQFMKDGTGLIQVIANPLPDDARIVDARWSFSKQCIELIVESKSFPELHEGDHVPPLPLIRFRRSQSIVDVGREFGIPVEKLMSE